MSNTYIESNKIHVFPFGSTRTVDPKNRIFNEQNVTQLIRTVTDNRNYVISYNGKDNNNDEFIEFVIQGYYFKANIYAVKQLPLYASIKIDKLVEADGTTYEYLAGGDDNNTFTGILFHNDPISAPSEDDYISLQLLDAEGNVPHTSLKKMYGGSLDVSRIYCGTSTEIMD